MQYSGQKTFTELSINYSKMTLFPKKQPDSDPHSLMKNLIVAEHMKPNEPSNLFLEGS